MGKKIVAVTGATGFLGSHLVKKLQQNGVTVKTFDRKIHDFNKPETLFDLVKDCDVIFHLAAIVNDDKPSCDFNIESTKNLLFTINKVVPKCKIIFASSFAVYKTPEQGEIIDEKFDLDPRNNYGKSKLICESILHASSEKDNIKNISLRLSNVYGPGMKPNSHSVIATFIEKISNNEPIIVNGDGSQKRDFIYIDDVINAFIMALQNHKLKNNAINICSGQEISILGLVNLIEKYLNKKAIIKFKNSKSKEGGYWKANNKYAKTILGWTPKIDLKEGLQITINHSKNS